MSDSILDIRNLSKSFADVTPLRDITCKIGKGEVISVIGPSGTGKSTLLRCLNRLEDPDGGQILYHGEDITGPKVDFSRLRLRIGMVFQTFNLFSNMDVLDNTVIGPVTLLGKTRADAEKKALELLKTVGMVEKIYAWPDELSGGQKQRVAIARALAMEPEILLFDEPTSALDPTMVEEVNTVIRSLAGEGMTMLIVTHDMEFARSVSTRVLFLSGGVICEEGTPEEIFDSPQKEETRQFILKQKTLEIRIDDGLFDFADAQGRLIAFCKDRFMSSNAAFGAQHIFEEIVMENLLVRQDVFPIRMNVQCRDDGKSLTIAFHYSGSTYNPLEDTEASSYKIVSRYIEHADFSRIGDINHLEIMVKEVGSIPDA